MPWKSPEPTFVSFVVYPFESMPLKMWCVEKAVDQFDCVFEMSGFSHCRMPIDSNQRDSTAMIVHAAMALRRPAISR